MEALVVETKMGPSCSLVVYMQRDWKAADGAAPRKGTVHLRCCLCRKAGSASLSPQAGPADTPHFSPSALKVHLSQIQIPFILGLLITPAFQPPNIFFHPQQQLYPVGRGNLGQVTLSFCVFLSPVHERVIISLCRWDLLLHPPLTCHDSPPSHLLL